jgi:hypothetical protein
MKSVVDQTWDTLVKDLPEDRKEINRKLFDLSLELAFRKGCAEQAKYDRAYEIWVGGGMIGPGPAHVENPWTPHDRR